MKNTMAKNSSGKEEFILADGSRGMKVYPGGESWQQGVGRVIGAGRCGPTSQSHAGAEKVNWKGAKAINPPRWLLVTYFLYKSPPPKSCRTSPNSTSHRGPRGPLGGISHWNHDDGVAGDRFPPDLGHCFRNQSCKLLNQVMLLLPITAAPPPRFARPRPTLDPQQDGS